MNSFKAFCRKEIIEGHRSRRAYILMGIFMLFGMASPILARYMQEIMGFAMGSQAPVLLSEPVWTDSWGQFYNNLAQMGGISIILLFMSSVSGEKMSKTASLTLTKNLSPAEFIIAKYCAAAGTIAVAFLPAMLVCWGYTNYLFGFGGQSKLLIISGAAYLMSAFVLTAVTMLASTVAKTWVEAAILSFGGYLLLVLSSYFPAVGGVMPGRLLQMPASVVAGADVTHGLGVQIAVAAAITLCCVWGAVRALELQEL